MVLPRMAAFRKWVLLSLCLGVSSLMQAQELVEELTVKERPRLYRGPYNDGIIDSFYYGGYYGYSSLFYPFYSPLGYYGPTYPGRSTVTFAVGSDGYVGTSFSTSDRIKGTNIVYGISASWEQGEHYYFPGSEYSLSRISPSLSWSNGRTSIFVAAEFSEYSMDRKSRTLKDRPRVDTGLLHSADRLERERDSVTDFKSVHAGLSQQIGDSMSIYLGISEDMFDTNQLSLGISDRFYDLGIRDYR